MLAENEAALPVERKPVRPNQGHQPISIVGLPADIGGIVAGEAALFHKDGESGFGIPLADHVRGNVAKKQKTLKPRVHPNRAFKESKTTRQSFDFGVRGNNGVRGGIQSNDPTKILGLRSCSDRKYDRQREERRTGLFYRKVHWHSIDSYESFWW